MIRITGRLWIGDSADESVAYYASEKIEGVLNVAQDLQPTCGWSRGLDYMHVGLIDGPGNSPAAYHAAVLALVALLRRCRTLVCCHTGGRSLTVALMYLHLTGGRGWDGNLDVLRERVDGEFPAPHEVHRAAFDGMNWRLLASCLGD